MNLTHGVTDNISKFQISEGMAKLFGLGYHYWREVSEVLHLIIPVYDKVNMAISWGRADEYRRKGIKGNIHLGNRVLDAGSGFGNMSKMARDETEHNLDIVLYDPLPSMLSGTKKYLPGSLHKSLASGVFEFMPFRGQIFDAVMCGYSLRDAIELESAIAEMHRVLKKEGLLVVVDLGKPDNRILRALVSFYLEHILSIVAFLVAGQLGLKFKTIHGTFKRWPRNSELYALLCRHFSEVKFETGLMGAAVIVLAYKK
jgi:demethylmenaquinone methyltransferase / 2-methoxy-6-polyprenyl-1,4-benzoquinol methylase